MKEALEIMIEQIKEQMVSILQDKEMHFGTTMRLKQKISLIEALLKEKFNTPEYRDEKLKESIEKGVMYKP